MLKFNPLVADLPAPPIPQIGAWARAYDGAQGPLLDMSQAAPGFAPPAALLTALGQAAASPKAAGYGPIAGELALRSVYAAEICAIYGADIGAQNIQITAGCNQAFVACALALLAPGETMLMTNPYYFNHQSTLAMLGLQVDLVPSDAAYGFLPDLEALEQAIRPGVRALALVSPNNPTGAIYPPDLLLAIFHLCRRKRIWLILDETYRDFLPEGHGAPHLLLRQPGWQNHLIGLYSFSKSCCIPGHRLGAITAGVHALAQIEKVMDNLQICAPRAAQIALAAVLPDLKPWQEENRREIARRSVAMRQALDALEDWEIVSIGAYFAYVRHPYPDIASSFVAEKLGRIGGVLTVAGDVFGAVQEAYLRFAFANAPVSAIETLEDRLSRFSLPGI
ncbi:aspartate/tyrosine/aromatic aminotransferase [Rhizobium rhizosphaerae]|uniref:aspartate transaminase n=1 Tax=Xaviernesmea rhizosphaerae TaxID=1672749 RepID=A0ABX3P813_9HYPH|nr:aminotransferase [Xaviernesmea rhizosphaerae]OQP84257.1 aspartate/tyrosine/aromatic aminotransferase [Xaviernesmea rhizosphaerae]